MSNATMKTQAFPLVNDAKAATKAFGMTLAAILASAERHAYRAALERHAGNITATAAELDVSRVTASRAVERLGLRAWLDERYPHRDPATVGRRGDTRKVSWP